MQNIISIANLSKTYASGFSALKGVDLNIRDGEIIRVARAQRRRQDDADQHRLRHRHASERSVTVAVATTSCGLPRGPRADRSGAAGTDDRRLRDGLGDGELQPRPVRQAPRPGHIEKLLKQLSLWDKKDEKIMTLSGGMKRRVLIAKALSHEPRISVPRRADRRRRRRAAQDMWNMVRGTARRRRHRHPDHPLHRGSRGDGRPHRRHQQGRDDPGRGQAG